MISHPEAKPIERFPIYITKVRRIFKVFYAFLMTPQAIFLPALPEGCVRKSSGAS